MQSVDQPVSDVLLADQGLRVGEKYDAVRGGQNLLPHRSIVRVYNFCHLISIAHIVSRMYFPRKFPPGSQVHHSDPFHI